MIDPGHALLWASETPRTYRPDCAWCDLSVSEMEAALRLAGVMAYPVRRRWDWLRLAVYGGSVVVSVGIGGGLIKVGAALWGAR